LQHREELLRLLYGAAVVLLAVDYEEGRGDLLRVTDGALAPQGVHVAPRHAVQLPLHEVRADVGGAVHAGPVADAALRDRAPELAGLAHQPVGHEAAVRAAR